MSTLKMSDEDFEKNMEFISQNFGPALADSFRARDKAQRAELDKALQLFKEVAGYGYMLGPITAFIARHDKSTVTRRTVSLRGEVLKEVNLQAQKDDPKNEETCRDCNGTGWFYGERDLGPCPCPEGSKKP